MRLLFTLRSRSLSRGQDYLWIDAQARGGRRHSRVHRLFAEYEGVRVMVELAEAALLFWWQLCRESVTMNASMYCIIGRWSQVHCSVGYCSLFPDTAGGREVYVKECASSSYHPGVKTLR